MEAVKYLKEKARMCKGNEFCYNCPLDECIEYEKENPEEAVEIVEKWSEEHPQKTILQDFLEKYPNAPVYTEGQPRLCPQVLGYFEGGCTGAVSCRSCWNRPLEG